MAFRLKTNESVIDGVRRIAREQVKKALRELDDESLGSAETIHQVRKRCKKLRGLIRLVRPAFEQTYATENDWFRETAKALSPLRDAQVMQDTYDRLMRHFDGQLNRRSFATVRREFTEQRKQLVSEQVDVDKRLVVAQSRLVTARERIEDWKLGDDGFGAIGAGIAKTYGRAVDAMQEAESSPSPKRFHEWRKRVKYHWYHCRLLENVWPKTIKARSQEARRLSNMLGDDHDLDVMRSLIDEQPDAFGDPKDIDALQALIQQRRSDLQKDCLPLGKCLFAEKPGRFVKRMAKYWRTTMQ